MIKNEKELSDIKDSIDTYRNEVQQLRGQSVAEGKDFETDKKIDELENKIGKLENMLGQARKPTTKDNSDLNENIREGLNDLKYDVNNAAKDF